MEALLRRFERFGRLVGVASNRFFLPETIVALGEIAHELAMRSEEAGFTAAEFNKRSGIGRNLTIIVLEYLDAIGVTRRAGDLRHVVRSARGGDGVGTGPRDGALPVRSFLGCSEPKVNR